MWVSMKRWGFHSLRKCTNPRVSGASSLIKSRFRSSPRRIGPLAHSVLRADLAWPIGFRDAFVAVGVVNRRHGEDQVFQE